MGIYYKETYKSIIIAILPAIVLGRLIVSFISLGGWIGFILKGCIYTLLYCFVIFFFGLNKVEKAKIISVVTSRIKYRRKTKC